MTILVVVKSTTLYYLNKHKNIYNLKTYVDAGDETVSSGQAQAQFVEFTPPNTEESNSSAQTSSSASSANVTTPQASKKRRKK